MVGTRMCYPVIDFWEKGFLPCDAELKSESKENLFK